MHKGLKITLFAIIPVIILILASTGVIFGETASADNYIFKGVHVKGIDVGGLTQEDARKLLEKTFNEPLADRKINVVYNNSTYPVEFKQFNVHYDVDSAVKKAYDYGKSGNIIDKTLKRWELRKSVCEIGLNVITDEAAIGKEVKKLAKQINVNPVDAKIHLEGNDFKIIPEVEGIKVNEDKLSQLIKLSLNPESSEGNVTVPADNVEARVKASVLAKIDTKISSFTTAFRPSDVNRTGNLKIASQSVDGTLLLPGQVFSMNKALGPRVEAKGYKEAPVIIKNTVVPGLAGGICQVTTTIYNAALLANFQIVARSQHGLTVSYVGVGRDATISGDVIDLKFKNTNQYPIYINVDMGKSTLTVNFYGSEENPDQSVEIATEIYEKVEPEIEYVKDPSLEKGKTVVEQKPIHGIKSRTYRKVYSNGKLVKNELISKDYYKEVDGIIKVGTKVPPTPPPPPTDNKKDTNTSNPPKQDNNSQENNNPPVGE